MNAGRQLGDERILGYIDRLPFHFRRSSFPLPCIMKERGREKKYLAGYLMSLMEEEKCMRNGDVIYAWCFALLINHNSS